ncbi:MAG TPA: chemotaxis protein CheX [Pirellulales bacterium]|jgi:chemotaxis protein CheX|nr:chemotaxis protein CheX [Pirellulales bacterium]
MNAAHINPFISSALTVFETMLGVKLARGQLYLKAASEVSLEVSAIIGLSGKARGTVVLSMSQQTAMAIAEVLLGEKTEGMSPATIDAIGEVTNMVAGGAKAQLEQFDMRMTIPTVIVGHDVRIEFPSKVPPLCIPFESPWGRLSIEVGLVEQGAEAAVPA